MVNDDPRFGNIGKNVRYTTQGMAVAEPGSNFFFIIDTVLQRQYHGVRAYNTTYFLQAELGVLSLYT